MTLRVGSWNIEGRLSDLAISERGTPQEILTAIVQLDLDILFLPEACSGDMVDPDISDKLRSAGYDYRVVPYQEGSPLRTHRSFDAPSYMLLSRLPLKTFHVHRLGDLRNILEATVEDPITHQTLRIIGIHLDDRSEALRLRQLPDLLQLIQANRTHTLVCGDFNAMHADDPKAALCRGIFVQALGTFFVPDLMGRVREMADGTTLARLESEGGLRDVDSARQPTTTPKMRGREWLPSVRLIQIDHMMVSPGVRADQFQVSADLGSDHRAIMAAISLDKNS